MATLPSTPRLASSRSSATSNTFAPVLVYRSKDTVIRLPFQIIQNIDFEAASALLSVKIESKPVRGVNYDIEAVQLKFVLPEFLFNYKEFGN